MSQKTIIGIILMIAGFLIMVLGISYFATNYDICWLTAIIGLVLFIIGFKILGIRLRKWAGQ